MKQFLAGGGVAILLIGGGFWFWQGQASLKSVIPPPPPAEVLDEGLPVGSDGLFGAAPPGYVKPPKAPKASREEVRFNRYDRNRDDIISRVEMLSTRTKDFKKLDKDNNNLLSFEEWAVATAERFSKADGNGNGLVTRVEFAATKPKVKVKATCKC
jgi:hypothetical protein